MDFKSKLQTSLSEIQKAVLDQISKQTEDKEKPASKKETLFDGAFENTNIDEYGNMVSFNNAPKAENAALSNLAAGAAADTDNSANAANNAVQNATANEVSATATGSIVYDNAGKPLTGFSGDKYYENGKLFTGTLFGDVYVDGVRQGSNPDIPGPNSDKVTESLNNIAKLLKVDNLNEENFEVTADENGNVTKLVAKDSSNYSYIIIYENNGDIKITQYKKDDASADKITSTFDKDGNLKQTLEINGTTKDSVETNFDANGNKTSKVEVFANPQNDVAKIVTTYDDKGNITSVVKYDENNKEIKNEVITFSNGKTLELKDGETYKTDINKNVFVTSADGKTVTKYDKDGVLKEIKETTVAEDGTKTELIKYFNNAGVEIPSTIREIVYKNDGITYTDTRYNKSGEQTAEIKRTIELKEGDTYKTEDNGVINVTSADGKVLTIYRWGYKSLEDTTVENADGSKTLTRINYIINNRLGTVKQGTTQVFNLDKDGRVVKSTNYTSEGKISFMYEYSNFDGNGKAGKVIYTNYDENGEKLCSLEDNKDGYPGAVISGNALYISFSDKSDAYNGRLLLTKGQNAVINADGTVDITNADGTVQKYDKDGKEIKVIPENFGTKEYLSEILGVKAENMDEVQLKDGKVVYFVDKTTYGKGLVEYEMKYNEDGSWTTTVTKDGKVQETITRDAAGKQIGFKKETDKGTIEYTKSNDGKETLKGTSTAGKTNYTIIDNNTKTEMPKISIDEAAANKARIIFAKDVFVDVSGGKTATINEDGSVEIKNRNGVVVEKFDKDGFQIVDNKKTRASEVGSAAYIQNALKKDFALEKANANVRYDSEGRITSFVDRGADGKGNTIYQITYLNGKMDQVTKIEADGTETISKFNDGKEVSATIKYEKPKNGIKEIIRNYDNEGNVLFEKKFKKDDNYGYNYKDNRFYEITETNKDGSKVQTRLEYINNGSTGVVKSGTTTVNEISKDGNCTKSTQTWDNGSRIFEYSNYDENGKYGKVAVSNFDKDGKLTGKIEDNNDGYPEIITSGNSIFVGFSGKANERIAIDKGQSAVIKADGTVEITSADGKTVKKYDKDGKEITDGSDPTPEVKKGSVEYIAQLLGNDIKFNEDEWKVTKDTDGNVIKIEPKNDTTAQKESSYEINYKTNGEIEITEYPGKGLAGANTYTKTYNAEGRLIKETHPSNGFTVGPTGWAGETIYNADGSKVYTKTFDNPDEVGGVAKEVITYDKDGKEVSVQKFDKDGKEIVTTAESVFGKADYFANQLNIGLKAADITVTKNTDGKIEEFTDKSNNTYKVTYSADNKTITITKIKNNKNFQEIEVKIQNDGTKLQTVKTFDNTKDNNPLKLTQTKLLNKDNNDVKWVVTDAYTSKAENGYPRIEVINNKRYVVFNSKNEKHQIVDNEDIVFFATGYTSVRYKDENGKVSERVGTDGVLLVYDKDGNRFGSKEYLVNAMKSEMWGSDKNNRLYNAWDSSKWTKVTYYTATDKGWNSGAAEAINVGRVKSFVGADGITYNVEYNNTSGKIKITKAKSSASNSNPSVCIMDRSGAGVYFKDPINNRTTQYSGIDYYANHKAVTRTYGDYYTFTDKNINSNPNVKADSTDKKKLVVTFADGSTKTFSGEKNKVNVEISANGLVKVTTGTGTPVFYDKNGVQELNRTSETANNTTTYKLAGLSTDDYDQNMTKTVDTTKTIGDAKTNNKTIDKIAQRANDISKFLDAGNNVVQYKDGTVEVKFGNGKKYTLAADEVVLVCKSGNVLIRKENAKNTSEGQKVFDIKGNAVGSNAYILNAVQQYEGYKDYTKITKGNAVKVNGKALANTYEYTLTKADGKTSIKLIVTTNTSTGGVTIRKMNSSDKDGSKADKVLVYSAVGTIQAEYNNVTMKNYSMIKNTDGSVDLTKVGLSRIYSGLNTNETPTKRVWADYKNSYKYTITDNYVSKSSTDFPRISTAKDENKKINDGKAYRIIELKNGLKIVAKGGMNATLNKDGTVKITNFTGTLATFANGVKITLTTGQYAVFDKEGGVKIYNSNNKVVKTYDKDGGTEV